MALVNDAKKEIHAKIVYYGPGRAGKTTNLEYIYNKLKPEYRGKFKFLNTQSGRMVFFDFMRPELAGVKDYTIHFHLYTVPGEVTDGAIWKNVLKGVDGIVFIADLDSSRTLENRRSLEDLTDYLATHDTTLADVCCLFQFNKKDVAGASTPEDLKNLLDTGEIPVMHAAAGSGEGVLPTLSEMVKMVLQKLRDTSLVVEEQVSSLVGEPLPGQDLPPLEAEASAQFSSYAAAEETESPVCFGEDENRAAGEELAEESLSLEEPADEIEELQLTEEPEGSVEEMAFPKEPEGPIEELTFPEEPEPLEMQDVLPEEEFMSLADSAEDSFGMPEPATGPTGFSEGTINVEPCIDAPAPEISLDGTLEYLGNGRYRLPLVIRYAEKEKRTALTLSLGFE